MRLQQSYFPKNFSLAHACFIEIKKYLILKMSIPGTPFHNFNVISLEKDWRIVVKMILVHTSF